MDERLAKIKQAKQVLDNAWLAYRQAAEAEMNKYRNEISEGRFATHAAAFVSMAAVMKAYNDLEEAYAALGRLVSNA